MIVRDVQEVISRAVSTFVDPENTFQKKLEAKAKGEYEGDIVIKLGVDPTRPDIHLGHAVILRKLRQFQDMGAKVVFLVGDITAQIGDPTGKSKVRPEISQEEVAKNMKTFLDQVGKILRTEPEVFSWITNSEWFIGPTDIAPDKNAKVEVNGQQIDSNSILAKSLIYENTRLQKTALKSSDIYGISLLNLLSVLRRTTHSRLIDRDMFQERLKNGEELYMHEMMYPILQGLDSVAIARIYGSCDLEIGGTDQTFNMLMGRDMMKISGLKEQAVMSLEILPGLDGKEKMSKSLDNYIAITDEPSNMYGKVMSIPDEVMPVYFRLATYTPLEEVEKIDKEIKSGKGNPRDTKMRLARQIVAEYHGEDAAEKAEADFIETFSKGGIPKDVETVKASKGDKLVDILLTQSVIASKTEWRRLIDDGAVKVAETDERISEADATLEEDVTLKVGKRRFIKIELL
jgi:tyrosyl-tRNA synthetase